MDPIALIGSGPCFADVDPAMLAENRITCTLNGMVEHFPGTRFAVMQEPQTVAEFARYAYARYDNPDATTIVYGAITEISASEKFPDWKDPRLKGLWIDRHKVAWVDAGNRALLGRSGTPARGTCGSGTRLPRNRATRSLFRQWIRVSQADAIG